MEYFKKYHYENVLMQDGRQVYAQVLIAADFCEDCRAPIIGKVQTWYVRMLFARRFSLARQIRRSGWKWRYGDTNKCEACAERVHGFICALCGMERKLDQIAHSFGERVGWQDRICMSCTETQPGILVQRKVNELRAKHTALTQDADDSDDAEESE